MKVAPIAATAFTVSSADGYPLAATRYSSTSPANATIIVAGATGVQQRFYRGFAEYAASGGYEVITFDYRGLGGSSPGALRGFKMDYSDWATLDLAAVIEAARDGRPLLLVGHSFGGVAFGLVPNIGYVDAVYAYGAGAGWHGWMSRYEALKVLLLWHIVGPITSRIFGFIPGQMLGLGSDLPIGVYRDWKRWTRFKRLFFDDPLMSAAAQKASQVQMPVMAANSIDDAWAPPRSRDALMSGYTGAKVTTLDIDPASRDLGPIGHVGYFRESAKPLWHDALDWLDAHRDRRIAEILATSGVA